MKSKPHIAVIGAGAFGGWTALHLLELGAHVTLLDNWGPGNSRASSGGETRIMRGTYGPNQPYTALAARAFKLWGKYENRWKHQLLHRTGVLWMVSSKDDDYERGSLALLREEHIKFQQLSTAQMKKRWPQINFSDVRWGIFESECGYLDARVSCQMVVDAFTGAGGTYRQVAALADGLEDAPLRSLRLSDGSRIRADYYVFACGPWLGKLFPEAVGKNIQPTKQDIFFFGPPARDSRFTDAHLPVWGDHGKRFFYGIPGSDRRGFKVADDTRGAAFDPTNGERVVSPATLKRVREYLSFRFSAMKEAPLIETRVCQYEQTLDSDFIVDRHPHMENVWLLGGGSGHGFKHGPALGEIMAEMILKAGTADERWQLARFSKRRKS
ncbi:MAG: FAD-dependent oxidoreductase [Candidatus Sulfotelmatobacter sp.]